MVLITLVDGKKGSGDILALVTAQSEPLTFGEWLFLGKCYLDSEAVYYPIKQGFICKAMLMNNVFFAIQMNMHWDLNIRI